MQKAQQVWGWFASSTAQIQTVLVLAATAVLPLAMLPLGDNFLVGSKQVVFLLLGILTLGLWMVSVISKKSVQITLSSFLFPLLALGGVVLVSIFGNATPFVPQFLGWGGIYLMFVIVSILGSSLVSAQSAQRFMIALAIPALLIVATAFAEVLQIGPSTVINAILKTNYPHSPIFSLAGSPLIASQVLFAAASGIVGLLLSKRNSKKMVNPAWIVLFFIFIAGLGINLYTLYSARAANQLFLPYNAGWTIAIESLKSAKTALIGTSPDNYLNVFLQFKPGWINLTNYWNLQFSQSSNTPLTLLPTIGVLGLLAWVWLAVQIVRGFIVARPEAKPAAAVALGTVILQLLLPPNVVTTALQALALIAWVAADKEHLKDVQLHAFTVQVIKSEAEVRREPHHSNLMAYVISALALVAFGYMGYWYVRFVGGQWFEFQAMMAGLNNQVVQTYELQQQMIIWNPTSAAYRRAYSITNMGIAVALSNVEDAPQEDRQQIVPLVQQSIREAKAAAEIEPNNSLNWVNLGRVYSNLIGAAQGADAWSIGAYTRAQAMAPTDPILTLELGGVLLQSGQLPAAEQLFTRAVELKPDWPNATYNLAYTARQNGNFGKSLEAYQQTLNLVQNNSELYAKVKAEFEATQREAQRKNAQAENVPEVTRLTDQEAKAALVKPATTSAKLRSLTTPSASETAELSPEVKQELQNTPIEGGP